MKIETAADYTVAMEEAARLTNADPAPDTEAGQRLNVLVDAIIEYECDQRNEIPNDASSHGSWNYRIVKYREPATGYGLHEVYYDADGEPWDMTEEACGFACDSDENAVTEIVKALRMAMNHAQSYPILEQPERWPGKNPGGEDT